jgi:hypothetical protein
MSKNPKQLDSKIVLSMPFFGSRVDTNIKMPAVGEDRRDDLISESNPLRPEEDYLSKMTPRAKESFSTEKVKMEDNVEINDLPWGCDLIRRSETPIEEDIKNIVKDQYIITDNGLWFVDCTKKSLEELSFLNDSSLLSLLKELKFVENRPATKAERRLITSYTGHIRNDDLWQIIGGKTESLFIAIKAEMDAMQNPNRQDLSNLLKKYQASGIIRELNTRELDSLCKIINFSKEKTPLYYENINQYQAAFLLFQSIVWPSIIDQGQGSVCGAAAFTQLLISSQPTLYVNASLELLQKGSAKINDLALICSDKREKDVNIAFMDALMNAANPVFGYNRKNVALVEEILGRTRAKIIAKMMRSAGLDEVEINTYDDQEELANFEGKIGAEVWKAITIIVDMYGKAKSAEITPFDKHISELDDKFKDPSYRSIFLINAPLIQEIRSIIFADVRLTAKQINWTEELAAKEEHLNNPSFMDVVWSKHYINVKSFKIDPNKDSVTLSFETSGMDFKDITIPMSIFKKNYTCNISGKINPNRTEEELSQSIEQQQQTELVYKGYKLTTDELERFLIEVKNQAETAELEGKAVTIELIETELNKIISTKKELVRNEAAVAFFKSKYQSKPDFDESSCDCAIKAYIA